MSRRMEDSHGSKGGSRMQRKDRIFIITLVAISLGGISSCAQMAGGELELVEGKFHSSIAGISGFATAYFLTLNETRVIQRIVIHPNAPIKNVDIYVRVKEDNWKLVKQIKGYIDASTPISVATRGDAIRVVQKSASRNYEYIQKIEAFSVPR